MCLFISLIIYLSIHVRVHKHINADKQTLHEAAFGSSITSKSEGFWEMFTYNRRETSLRGEAVTCRYSDTVTQNLVGIYRHNDLSHIASFILLHNIQCIIIKNMDSCMHQCINMEMCQRCFVRNRTTSI